MPRPNKAFRRLKINAAIAYKRGEREEAYKLWANADSATKEHLHKKRNKRKIAAEAEAAKKAEESAAATAAESKE